MLKAFAVMDEWRDSLACRTGAETLLRLWSESITEHPYIFYMGTDFRKLKVPFVWYDPDACARSFIAVPWLIDDPRLREMVNLLQDKSDGRGALHA